MQTTADILQVKGSEVWAVEPDMLIIDAIRLMADKQVGALLVMEEGEKLVGIVTERDYIRKVALEGRSSKTSLVREIMSTQVLCARLTQTVEECMALMSDKRARHLPVVEQKRVVGLVSIGDLVKSVISEQQFEIEQLRYYIAH